MPSLVAIDLYAWIVEEYLAAASPVMDAWKRTLTTSVGWAISTASPPVVIPAATLAPMFMLPERVLPVDRRTSVSNSFGKARKNVEVN